MSSVKRKWWIGLAGVIVVVIGAIAFWPGPKEPEYQGKKLSEWAAVTLTSNTTIRQQEEATEAIRAIGTNALPFLISWISYDPARADSIYTKLPQSIRSTRFAEHIFGVDRHWRAESARVAFHVLRQLALPAMPDLIQMLNKPCSPIKAQNVAMSLASMGEPALTPMLRILANKQAPSAARAAVVEALMTMGLMQSELLPAIPVLADCVRDTNCPAAEMCAMALGHFRLKPLISVPALAQAVDSPDRNVRIAALQALGMFGADGVTSLPTVIRGQADSDPLIRQTATDAANRIASEALRTNGIRSNE